MKKEQRFLFAPDEETTEKLALLMTRLNLDRTKTMRHVIYFYDETLKKAETLHSENVKINDDLNAAKQVINACFNAALELTKYIHHKKQETK